MARFHKGRDGWGRDSYSIPQYAVVGSSDCGMWPDSPCPSDKVRDELQRFRRDLKTETGIVSRFAKATRSGNVFMVKQWVAVKREDFPRAAEFALQWLEEHHDDTRYIHDADLKELRAQQHEQTEPVGEC